MRLNIKDFFILLIPIALTLSDTSALGKKKKRKPPIEKTTPAASPASESTPAPAAATTTAPTTSTTTTTTTTATTPAASPAPEQKGAEAAAVTPASPPVEAPASTATAPAAPAAPATAAPAPTRPKDHVRFRGGISASGGGEFVSGFAAGLGGIDGRLGVQINNLVGLYVQPHVSAGTGKVGAVSGATGTVAATAMVDFTIIDRIFIGTGVGGGLVNNPGGAVLQFRAGGYPVMKLSQEGPRRKGLMVGLDTRIFFTSIGPVVQIMGGIGYEAF